MNRRITIRLFAAATTTLTSLVILMVVLWRTYTVSSFQFLHGRKPVLGERFSSVTTSVYSFPAALDEVCSEASTELAAHGFMDMPFQAKPFGHRRFLRQDRSSFVQVIIWSAKLSEETTATQYAYKSAPGWVSVEVKQRRPTWRHCLNWVSRGLIPPPPPDPPIGRLFRSERKTVD